MTDDLVIGLRPAAKALGVSYSTLLKWIRDGTLARLGVEPLQRGVGLREYAFDRAGLAAARVKLDDMRRFNRVPANP